VLRTIAVGWTGHAGPVDFDPCPSVDAIDARWMTRALGGLAGGESVTAVDAHPLGTGQVGENVRFSLTWSEDRGDLPATVVGKFPSRSETSLAAAAATDTYVKEVGFYRDLQTRVAVRTPVVHHLGDDVANLRFVLLMEDITPASQGDQLAGADVAHAELAVAAAADLHGSTWGLSGELAELEWLDAPSEQRVRDLSALYRMLSPGFVERYREDLDADDLDLAPWLADRFESWLTAIDASTPESCLVHNDFRLDNLLFGTGDDAPPITVVDWQTVGIGSGPVDVAYYLGAGLLPAERAVHEHRLVATYAAHLGRHGVTVTVDDVMPAYRLGSASGYVMAVIASQLVVRTERGDQMFVAMASRHADQMRTLDLAGLIG